MDLALKNARIVDSCDKSSGFADFENRVDHGSGVNHAPRVRILARILHCACLDVRV